MRYDKNGLACCSCFTQGAPNCVFALLPAVTTGVHGSWTTDWAANNPPFVLNWFVGCVKGVDDGAATVKAKGVGVYVADGGTNCVGGTNGVCFISFIVGLGIRSIESDCCESENGFAANGGGVGLPEKDTNKLKTFHNNNS